MVSFFFRKNVFFNLIARPSLIVLFLLLPIRTGQTAKSLAPGVSAVQATWLYGQVALAPSLTKTGYLYQYSGSPQKDGSWLAKLEKDLKPDVSAPAVIWLHGCGGQGKETNHALRIFALSGYTVFAPDSFARPGRRTFCYRKRVKMSIRVAMRQEEVKYALSQIRNFPWVDQKHLVLAGFSEGSQAIAPWKGQEFRAHVLVGTDCRFNGRKSSAPDGVRVFNLVGTIDHWGYGKGCRLTKSQYSRGSMAKRYRGLGHGILYSPEVEDDLVAFLESLGVPSR